MTPRRLRLALVAPFVAAAAFAGWQQLGAQTFSGHDSDAPVDFGADRIELQDRQDRVVLSGNVDIRQGELRLRAQRTIVALSSAGSQDIERVTATGGVVVTRNDQRATGDVAIYDFNKRIITMVGNATLTRGGDTLRGNRFVIDLNSGVSAAEGRVSGTFNVPKKKN
ncbi:lipopolysaccharide transport periplasmic protein LptA [Novosphingobium album (ex Liu et al. 2023)]|uniref:Lipopolysaccharide transport periplasmic protein LptA n=1 Tax=Novosphingobium album (ex Liu et al. 2023) TaxID=3031130 RepID=A0ABT5WNQ4_9SPHN|nr:lipopolysaccharide transport periplasmic protein LptA [Novosphingobium album (ex Liu et al. 2023)]MDE8651679.1 lipopolysaccharide transport periplasmic protein LptA [Novosphingobium album (ex Liu et al. 2023)]